MCGRLSENLVQKVGVSWLESTVARRHQSTTSCKPNCNWLESRKLVLVLSQGGGEHTDPWKSNTKKHRKKIYVFVDRRIKQLLEIRNYFVLVAMCWLTEKKLSTNPQNDGLLQNTRGRKFILCECLECSDGGGGGLRRFGILIPSTKTKEILLLIQLQPPQQANNRSEPTSCTKWSQSW